MKTKPNELTEYTVLYKIILEKEDLPWHMITKRFYCAEDAIMGARKLSCKGTNILPENILSEVMVFKTRKSMRIHNKLKVQPIKEAR